MSNIAEELPKEIERCQELLQEYIAIGPPGKFAAMMIKIDIKKGLDALASGDAIEMLKAYETLKGNQ